MTLEARAVTPAEPDGVAAGVPPPRPHPADPPPSRPPSSPQTSHKPHKPHDKPHPESEPPPHSIAPRRPRTVGGAVFLLVLAGTLTGVVVVAVSRWQAGLTLIGVSLLVAAFARLVLPNGQAGMLGVRRKLVDVGTLLLLGAGLVALAALIPPRAPL